jgi:polysaccharide biosynthesis/export protein
MRKLLLFILSAFLLSSCGIINPSIMLKTGRNYNYDAFADTAVRAYKLSPNDIIEFRMYSNNGFKLIDLTNTAAQNNTFYNRAFSYDVEFDGTVKLPILGRVPLSGLTVREAENLLQEKYSAYYNDPFVMISVSNKRVIVFPGAAGSAQIVPLIYENTTLLEALATAGGIAQRGKAKKIKLIRGKLTDRKVYLIDLSKIEGLKQGDIILQANDIIYVEPRPDVARGIVTEIAPIISLISSTILIITLVNRLP